MNQRGELLLPKLISLEIPLIRDGTNMRVKQLIRANNNKAKETQSKRNHNKISNKEWIVV